MVIFCAMHTSYFQDSRIIYISDATGDMIFVSLGCQAICLEKSVEQLHLLLGVAFWQFR